MNYDLRHEYVSVTGIRSQLSELSSRSGPIPEPILNKFLMRVGQWISQRLYLCYERDSDNGPEYAYCMGLLSVVMVFTVIA